MVHFKAYRNWSIKGKLLIITALLILGSVFTVSVLSYLQYTEDFEDQSADRVQQIIDQVSFNIDTYLDDLFRLSISPYFNESVMAALEANTQSTRINQLNRTRQIEEFLDEMMILPRHDILRVFILTQDQVYSSGRVSTAIQTGIDFNQFAWYRQALTTQDYIFVPVHLEELVRNPKIEVFSIVKQLRSTKNTDLVLGAIKVDANYSGIETIVNKVDLGQEGGLFIVDENRNLIFSNLADNNEIEFYDNVLEIQQQDATTQHTTVQINNRKYLLNYSHIPLSNWTIVAVNSLQELNQNAIQTRNIAFLMALVSSCLAIIVLYFFVKQFSKPLLSIVGLMKEIRSGNLNVTFPMKKTDEIGYLGSSFNNMVTKIKDMLDQNSKLVQEVYEAQYIQKEAQMRALYNQIRPHFIFNTLNMISLQIQNNQQDQAVDHINKLSKILRSMATLDEEIRLGFEIELLDSYLSIQSSRFEGRLDYFIEIDPSLQSLMIPALLFQPIVENAVIHGCEQKKEKTTIRISSEMVNDHYVFLIEDNGLGMNSNSLMKLRNNLDQNEDTYETDQEENQNERGIGLVNVHRRIKMKYGAHYGIVIHSHQDQGTKVIITLPRDIQEVKHIV